MTCIVGMVEDGEVYIGGDSIAADGWDKDIIAERKVFRRRDILFGCAGSIRMMQLIQYHLVIPQRLPLVSDEEYIIVSLVGAIRQCLKDNGLLEVENAKEKTGQDCIIGYKGRLFLLQTDLSIYMSSFSSIAIGVGKIYAQTAMHTQQRYIKSKRVTPCVRIIRALEVAESLCIGVSPPFYVEQLKE